jgi:hypothetical protein
MRKYYDTNVLMVVAVLAPVPCELDTDAHYAF